MQSSLHCCSTRRTTFRNRRLKIDRKKSVPIKWYISSPRDAQLALALQQLEKDEVQNLEAKEQMIMRDGELVTIMKQQEENEAQKLMEK